MKEEGRKGEEQRGRERERKREREKEGRDRSCLFERKTEKEEIQASSRKEDLLQWIGGWSGHGLSLKETEQIITPRSFQLPMLLYIILPSMLIMIAVLLSSIF